MPIPTLLLRKCMVLARSVISLLSPDAAAARLDLVVGALPGKFKAPVLWTVIEGLGAPFSILIAPPFGGDWVGAPSAMFIKNSERMVNNEPEKR